MNDRFQFVSLLVNVVSAAGWLMVGFGLAMLGFSFIAPFNVGTALHVETISIPMAFTLMGTGVVLALFAENIRVLLAIEQNTRRMGELLEKRPSPVRRLRDSNTGLKPLSPEEDEEEDSGLGSIILKE